MIKALLKDCNTFKNLISSIRELITDANFLFTSDGLFMQAMDTSHVSLCEFQIPADQFDTYEISLDSFVAGINLTNLSKILQCSDKDTSLMLLIDEIDVDKLIIQFDSNKTKKSKTKLNTKPKKVCSRNIDQYELNLMNIDSQDLSIPAKECDTLIKMSSVKFQKLLQKLTIFGETCTISTFSDNVEFLSIGDIGSGKLRFVEKSDLLPAADADADADAESKLIQKDDNNIEITPIKPEAGEEEVVGGGNNSKKVKSTKNSKNAAKKTTKNTTKNQNEEEKKEEEDEEEDEENISIVQFNKNVQLSFSLKYLSYFAKACIINTNVQLYFSEDMPLIVEYKIQESGLLKFYLAPKFEE